MNRLLTTTFLLLVSVIGYSQTVKNFLNSDLILEFDNYNYELAWSSHPNESFYKQEYLIKGQTLESYDSMVLIDLVVGDFSVQDAVGAKVREIENAKKSNPLVHFTVLEKDDEVMIDFLISASSEDGQELLVVERNVYRYQKIKTSKGNGILVFGISQRAYGEEIGAFFEELKLNKNSLIVEVGNAEIPKIKLRK